MDRRVVQSLSAITPNRKNVADLYLAVSHGRVEEVRNLMKTGVNVNAPIRGSTPLGLAVYRRQPEIVPILIGAGADVNKMNSYNVQRVEPPLCAACRSDQMDIIEQLFKSPDINPNKRDFFHKSPLWVATSERNLAIIKTLLDHPRIRVNTPSTWSECPLYLSMTLHRRTNISRFLISRGCPLDVRDRQGLSALFWTDKCEEPLYQQWLLYSGAKQPCGGSPLPLLWISRNAVRARLLEVHGHLHKRFNERLELPINLKELLFWPAHDM